MAWLMQDLSFFFLVFSWFPFKIYLSDETYTLLRKNTTKSCLTIKPSSGKRQREIKEVKAMFRTPIHQNILCLVWQSAPKFFQSWPYIFYFKLYYAQCSSNKVVISSSIEILRQLNFLVYIYIKSKKNMMNLKYRNRDFWITIF